MQQKKTTKEEYQKCVNVVVEYINQHLGGMHGNAYASGTER